MPAAALSVVMLVAGVPWSFWMAGILYLVWASITYYVEYSPAFDSI